MNLDLQDRRLWIGGAGAVALLLVALAWIIAIGPMRSNTAQLNSQAAATVGQNSTLLAQNAALERDGRKLPAYRAKLARAIEALPPNPDLSGFTTSLSGLAERAGVTLSSIAVGTVAGATTVATAAVVPTTTSTTSAAPSSDTASGAATAPVAAPTSAAPSQLVAGVTLQVKGTSVNDMIFLEAVRLGARSALVTSAQLTDDGSQATLTAQINVFSAPVAAGQRSALHALTTGK